MGSDRAAVLAEQLTSIARELQSDPSIIAQSGAEQRAAILEAGRAIVHQSRRPTDIFIDQAIHVAELGATRLFGKWKVFENIPDDTPITYSALASKVGVEASLISRFSGLLAATGILEQVGPDKVAHTVRSKALANSKSAFNLLFDDILPSVSAMPAYFGKYGLKEPLGRYNTIMAFAAGTPEATVWEVMSREPERMVNFMQSMGTLEEAYTIVGSYNFGWVVKAATAAGDRAAVVDVGGGKGHAVKEICRRTPGLTIDRCVLEDLPDVLDKAKALNDPELQGVQMAPLDFHKEQPVKGALVYYIRRCLHDYSDEECVSILGHLSDAMAPDSRLLIVEQVLGTPPATFGAVADVILLTIGGKERTLAVFKGIASKANLEIREVHRTIGSDVAVVECVKI